MALCHAAGIAIVLCGALACSSGSGALPTGAPASRDDPGPSRDNPGAGRDVPPDTRDTPPATGAPVAAACIACDVVYSCTGALNGQFQLRTAAGMCTQALIDRVCSGAAFGGNGCTTSGGGAFTCAGTICRPGQRLGNPVGTIVPPTSMGSGGGVVDAG